MIEGPLLIESPALVFHEGKIYKKKLIPVYSGRALLQYTQRVDTVNSDCIVKKGVRTHLKRAMI